MRHEHEIPMEVAQMGKGFARREIKCHNDNFFGDTLKEMRIEKGITQIEAAQLLKITQPQWSAYEIGKTMPNLQTIILIAEAIEIDCFELIGRALDKTKYFRDNPIYAKQELSLIEEPVEM